MTHLLASQKILLTSVTLTTLPHRLVFVYLLIYKRQNPTKDDQTIIKTHSLVSISVQLTYKTNRTADRNTSKLRYFCMRKYQYEITGARSVVLNVFIFRD